MITSVFRAYIRHTACATSTKRARRHQYPSSGSADPGKLEASGLSQGMAARAKRTSRGSDSHRDIISVNITHLGAAGAFFLLAKPLHGCRGTLCTRSSRQGARGRQKLSG
jgi:hypothetical protein